MPEVLPCTYCQNPVVHSKDEWVLVQDHVPSTGSVKQFAHFSCYQRHNAEKARTIAGMSRA